jgi:hypothetical protein
LDYAIDTFGFSWPRHPRALFTFFPGATSTQWVRGTFAQ